MIINENLIKKLIDLSRKFIKQSAQYLKSGSTTVVNAGKSILKSVISILNNLMSIVVKSKSPKASALKTTLYGLLITALITALGLYAGIQVHETVNSETEDSSEIAVQNDAVKLNRIPSTSKPNPILYSYDEKVQCEASNMPSYINISMTWGPPSMMTALKGFRKISPPSIIVTGAENDSPKERYIPYNKSEASKEFDAIIVGSLNPWGNPSRFSQIGNPAVGSKYRAPPAILAPSDYSLTTTDDDGNYNKFGGTSGATPLVTGALAGFTWLSGFQPTGAEAKVLLKRTAIPLSASHDKGRHGPGMLNAYKLTMVAKKLKEECGGGKDKKYYINCMKSKIQDPATYAFPEDTDILALVDKNFPECSAKACFQKKESCDNVGAIFKRLRKAAFLNPHKKEYWRYLSCIYASAGFAENAKGMRNIYNGLLGAKYTGLESQTEYFIDKSCNVDEDCTYVSECNYDYKKKKYDISEILFKPANKDYVTECQGIVPCGDSCRCGSDKKKVIPESGRTYQLFCSKESFQCEGDSCRCGSDKKKVIPKLGRTYRLFCSKKSFQCVEEELHQSKTKSSTSNSGGQK